MEVRGENLFVFLINFCCLSFFLNLSVIGEQGNIIDKYDIDRKQNKKTTENNGFACLLHNFFQIN